MRKAAKTVKDLNRKLPGSNTPILLACENGADKALAALIEAGAKVANDGHTWNHPFCAAEEKEQVGGPWPKIVRYLPVARGATVITIIDDVAPGFRSFSLRRSTAPNEIDLT